MKSAAEGPIEDNLDWLVAHTELLFSLLLIVLILVVDFGWWLRQRSSDTDADRQSLVESARDGLIVLLGLLLGFSLPMVLPHYEQRAQLVIDEATKIAAAEELGQMLPEPFRGKILQLLRVRRCADRICQRRFGRAPKYCQP